MGLRQRFGQAILNRMVLTRNNLDYWCERGILFATLGMLVFGPLALGAVEEWAQLVLVGLASVGLTLWIARAWLSRKPKLLWPPLAWVVIAFTLYAVGRYFTADIEYAARMELIQVVLMAFMFLLAVNNLRGQTEIEWVSFTLIGLGTLISGYAMVQLITHSDKVWNISTGTAIRTGGTYISGNHLAGLLEQLMPLALAFMLVGRLKKVGKILLAYALLMMCGGLAATFSRAGWVSAAAGLVLVLGVLLCHKNHRLRAFLVLAVMITGGFIYVQTYLSKTKGFEERVKNTNPIIPGVVDMSSRFWMWGTALRMWDDHRIWGVGPGLFNYRFREYRPETIQLTPDRCHNDYLNLLVDWGVVGGVIVSAGIGIFLVGLLKTWPHVRREENDFGKSQSNRFAFFLGATGGLFALSVHSLMDFNLHIPANALVAVTLLGLLSSNLRFATEGYWVRGKLPLRLGISLAVGAVVVFFVWQEVRLGGETYWLAKADAQGNFSPERAAALERAFACEPKNFDTSYAIGECYRTESLDGGDNFRDLAQKAMDWYARGIKLNPHDGYNYLRTGMCLNWLGKFDESVPFYSQAEEHDPNGYYMVGNIGWHYVQTGDYAAARRYFERSMMLGGSEAMTARNYLEICNQKQAEKASGKPQLPAFY